MILGELGFQYLSLKKIGGKCQNAKIQMRHFEWFSNNVKAFFMCWFYISCLELDLLVILQNTVDFEWWIHWRILTFFCFAFWILQSFNLMVAVSHFKRLAIHFCIAVHNQSSRQINFRRMRNPEIHH